MNLDDSGSRRTSLWPIRSAKSGSELGPQVHRPSLPSLLPRLLLPLSSFPILQCLSWSCQPASCSGTSSATPATRRSSRPRPCTARVLFPPAHCLSAVRRVCLWSRQIVNCPRITRRYRGDRWAYGYTVSCPVIIRTACKALRCVFVCVPLRARSSASLYLTLIQLMLEWEHFKEVSVSVDEYEKHRRAHRSEDELRMNWVDRRRLLTSSGFTEDELAKAQDASRKVRQQRERTAKPSTLQISRKILKRIGRTFHPKSA